MIKVCHVTSAHQRYDVRVFRKECVTLAKAGYDCYLLVNDTIEDEINDGVKIISTGFMPSSRKDRFLKSHKYLLMKMIDINADIYHFHDPDLLSLADKMRKRGKKVIFDFHENVSEQIKDKEWIPGIVRNFISMAYNQYEKFYAKNFNCLITVSPNIVEKLKKENRHVFMITNYPIVDSDYKEPEFREKNVCFAGGISEQWCHELILDAIKDIPDCKFILAGNADNDYLEKLKRKPAWENTNYLGKIEFEKVKDIYADSMAGLALNVSSQVGKKGTLGNTKLFEFMLAGIPVICSDNELWKRIIDENECGMVVDPTNVNDIKNAIDYMVNHVEDAKKMGRNGRKAAIEKFNWDKEAKKLCKLYFQLEKHLS